MINHVIWHHWTGFYECHLSSSYQNTNSEWQEPKPLRPGNKISTDNKYTLEPILLFILYGIISEEAPRMGGFRPWYYFRPISSKSNGDMTTPGTPYFLTWIMDSRRELAENRNQIHHPTALALLLETICLNISDSEIWYSG